jgi:hypothetical protein
VLVVPIALKVLGVKAGPYASLPGIVETCRPQQIHGVVILTLDRPFGIQQAGIHEMRTRE